MEQALDTIFLWLTKVYLRKSPHKTIVVSGSVGKTSVTQAIATVMSEGYDVLTTKHNYNTHRGVPMTIFGLTIPSSRIGWLPLLFRAVYKTIFCSPKFSMLVLELGSDKPGDLQRFAFLKPDLAVITAATPEHMEFFKTIETVAKEELSTTHFAARSIINYDLVPQEFRHYAAANAEGYGESTGNTISTQGSTVTITHAKDVLSGEFQLIGRSGLSTLLAASTAAACMGLDTPARARGLAHIKAVSGRMNRLRGKNGSTIIDDTYNSSPEAVRVALDYLYEQTAPKKVVLLGMMNEMGAESEQLHRMVGSWCDPNQLNLVVTLGADANHYLAEEAEKKGCKVIRTNSPQEAGKLIENELAEGVLVLAKGSQNGVYAEEAVKLWLADPSDAEKLVRQHTYWPVKKSRYWVELT